MGGRDGDEAQAHPLNRALEGFNRLVDGLLRSAEGALEEARARAPDAPALPEQFARADEAAEAVRRALEEPEDDPLGRRMREAGSSETLTREDRRKRRL